MTKNHGREPGQRRCRRYLNSTWAIFSVLLLGSLLGGCAAPRGGNPSEVTSPAAETTAVVPSLLGSPTVGPGTASPVPPTNTPEPRPTATTTPTPPIIPTPVPSSTPVTIRAKIEIVWPHGGASVRDAELANVTAYLISEDGKNPPPCDWEPTVRLWAALNSQPARPIAVGEKRMATPSGRRFPVWDFNDIDVSAARDPANKLTFFVTVDGVQTLHNNWVHAADARTLFPRPDVPASTVTTPPPDVDAKIEVVWPHDSLPIDKATLANIAAYLFASGTQQAIPPDLGWSPTVRLHHSLNTETEKPEDYADAPVGASRVITTEAGIEFLAWNFDNIDVSAAQDPLNKIYFWLSTDDVPSFPNTWAHGASTPTIFPQPDILNSCR